MLATTIRIRRLLPGLLGWALVLCSPGALGSGQRPVLTVFAAASLTDVMDDLRADYRERSGVELRPILASSALLARQIDSGARADVFVSADRAWMDYLQGRDRIDPRTRRDVAGNALVLIAPADSPVVLRIAPQFPLLAALGPRGRLAIGDPESVPAGRYAQAALTTLADWSAVAPRTVRADNVRTALTFVARGEAPLGIVYATDVRSEPRVRIVDTFPERSHPPIRYPAAVIAGADPRARAFVDYLSGAHARAIFARFGFRPP